eukprot:5326465-Prymnesium_polylepis.1
MPPDGMPASRNSRRAKITWPRCPKSRGARPKSHAWHAKRSRCTRAATFRELQRQDRAARRWGQGLRPLGLSAARGARRAALGSRRRALPPHVDPVEAVVLR